MSQNKFYRLTVRNLSRPQIDAFATLFPKLHEAGLVEPKGATALVITLHPDVFRKANRQASAGQQLAGSTLAIFRSNPRNVKSATAVALSTKFIGLVAEEV